MLRHLENEKDHQLRDMLTHRYRVMKKKSDAIDKVAVMSEIEQIKGEMKKRKEK